MGIGCYPAGTILGYRLLKFYELDEMLQKSPYADGIEKESYVDYEQLLKEFWKPFVHLYRTKVGFRNVKKCKLTARVRVECYSYCEIEEEDLRVYMGIDLAKIKPNGGSVHAIYPRMLKESLSIILLSS